MDPLQLTIVGAGSSYTPELLEGLARAGKALPVTRVVLQDIDPARLATMHGFCRRYAQRLGVAAEITATQDLEQALYGADFIDTQIRVGGNAARVLDEKIPLKYGLVGQETTGAGGMMKAMRTIPVMLGLARMVEKNCPGAWIVNYTNPTGLVTEAVTRYTNANIAGFCSGGIFPKMWAAKALGLGYGQVRYDYVGLNHMNFISNITIGGRPATRAEYDAIAAENTPVARELVQLLGCIPSPYLQWYYHTRARVAETRRAPLTRGEEVMQLEKQVYAAYADETSCEKPAALEKRGGGGYSDVAMAFMQAVHNDADTWMVVNTPNRGAVRFLPDEAVVEIGCLVNKRGIQPLVTQVPAPVWGLICEVKNYEQLAVEAAVHGDRVKLQQALLAHPLVRDFSVVGPLSEELLEANRAYLPQFYG